MNKPAKAILLTLMASAFLAGCGGAGSIISALTRTKPEMLAWIMAGFNTHSANAGIEIFSGVFGARSRMALLSNGDIGVGDGEPSLYYDSFIGVWVSTTWTENGYTAIYSLDEAGTQPAGSATSSWVVGETGSTGSSEVRITAGPNAGYTLDSSYSTNTLTGVGIYTSTSVSPLYGSSQDSGQWRTDGSGTYTSRWQKGIDFKEYSGEWMADGSWQSTSTTSDGYRLSIQGRPDGSGQGSIEGQGQLLPATVVWDINGDGTITWADGSTSTFNWYGLGGGGASGGGSGGNPGDDEG